MPGNARFGIWGFYALLGSPHHQRRLFPRRARGCCLRWRRPHCPMCRARCEPLLGRHTHQQMASSQSNPACLSGLNAPRGHAPCPCSCWNPLQQWARRRWPCRSGAAIGLKPIKSIAASAYGISLGCRFGLIFLTASDTVQQPACAARTSSAKTPRNASHSARLTGNATSQQSCAASCCATGACRLLAGLRHRTAWFCSSHCRWKDRVKVRRWKISMHRHTVHADSGLGVL